MTEQLKKLISVHNDSFYEILTDLVNKKRLNFSDDYNIKKYLLEKDILRTTNVDKRVIEYIHKNLKGWHILVTNTNASKIFLILNEEANNNLNLCKKIKTQKREVKINDKNFPERVGNIGEPTVRYWIGCLMKLDLITSHDFSYGIENMWRKNDMFDNGDNPDDFIKESGKNKLKLGILKVTAYFCLYALEQKSIKKVKKELKEDFSFMAKPTKKEYFY